jgi:LmbE family N-acetylglucosaminyl deacetylase
MSQLSAPVQAVSIAVTTPDKPQPEFHLFLSPHLDDAVLSCGGMIHVLAASGHTVVVYTVMAGRPPRKLADSPILADLHTRWQIAGSPIAERRREDINALRALGAQPRHGTIPDCVYRMTYAPGGDPLALYPSEESLWHAINPADTAVPLLESMPLLYPQADVLHVPLGAGGHVDHLLVRDWGRRLARANPDLTVLYYEEYPYNTQASAAAAALKAYAPDVLEPVLYPLNEAAVLAKIASIAHYKSQISTFWQDASDMARAVRSDAAQIGADHPAEREWRVAR